MSKQIKAILGLLAFAVLLGAAFFAYNVLLDITDAPANIAEAHDIEGNLQRARDFIMEDAMGNEVRLSDFLGQPVVLNFWATWCPNCVLETPYFEALYHEVGNEVKILKVNLIGSRGETRSDVEAFMEAGGYTLPIYFDTTGDGALSYNVMFIPVTFFITAQGYLAATSQGMANEDILRQGIEIIIDR
ncbi:MAG: TlpA family protein disulfide reductase [Defluviitaleaceae bacterium]|nr:TlpA family protein disulfide reductase [Defluviitaleaceae bacterium]